MCPVALESTGSYCVHSVSLSPHWLPRPRRETQRDQSGLLRGVLAAPAQRFTVSIATAAVATIGAGVDCDRIDGIGCRSGHDRRIRLVVGEDH